MWFRQSASINQLSFTLAIYILASPCCLYAIADSHKMADIGHARGKPASTAHLAGKKKQDTPAVEKYLIEGKLEAGETALLAELKAHPADDQLRFSLGSLQFLRAVEKLSQSLYLYGLRNAGKNRVSILPNTDGQLPWANNPDSKTLSYEQSRKIVNTFLHDLSNAEATLVPITTADVKLPLHFGMIRLDLNGDGQAKEDEALWRLYAAIEHNTAISADKAQEFHINFDRGDVHWLRGYCHLLMAVCEICLAHDTKETFDCTAHLFFNKVDSPYKFLAETNPFSHERGDMHDMGDILDLVALIHLIHWPVVESERMTAALHHLESVTQQSKESWKWIMAEKDDDNEWLPNPEQTGVIPNAHVTKEMVDTWLSLMDQSAKVLAGEKLVPFWRGNDGYGVNVRKVFTEPKTFDLVIFVQGPGAAPYLQKGEMTEAGISTKLQRAFGREFPGFAIWFN
jgi:hypothetical protein